MDFQIHGISWHPVATDSMQHFNCSQIPANFVGMAEPVQKKRQIYRKNCGENMIIFLYINYTKEYNIVLSHCVTLKSHFK